MKYRKVKDVMTIDVRTVPPDATVKAVAAELDHGGCSALPVVDDERHVLGVVSETDLLHKITYQDDTADVPRFLRRHRTDRAKAEGSSVADLMTAPAVTVGPDASMVEAARLMERNTVKRLPVIDGAGQLVGIVSRGDLIRSFTRPDEEIRHEIEADVIRHVLLLPPGTATVEVVDGVVTVRGMLPRQSETEVMVELIRRVAGVVAVHDHLTYRLDDTTYRAIRDADAPRGVYY